MVSNFSGKAVIIINGSGGAGKDTLCEFARKQFRVRNVSSITPVKRLAAMAGWSGEKDAKSRKFLSDLKALLSAYNDFPTRCLLEEYESFRQSDEELLFMHVREPEEIRKIRSRITALPCLTLLVRRPDLAGESWGNASDDNVENYPYDLIYENRLPLEKAGDDFCRFLLERLSELDGAGHAKMVKVPITK